MKIKALLVALFTFSFANAQQVDNRGMYDKKDFEHIEIGWLNPLKNEPAKPITENGWSYPVNQTDMGRKIGTWLQQTYTPIGLLGELKLDLFRPPASKYKGTKYYGADEAEKDNRLALPNSYGALAKFHLCLSKTSTHKFFPTPGNHCYTRLDIMANNVELITKQVIALSTPTDYYCTMPDYTVGQKGEYEKDWLDEMTAYRNFTGSPNLQPYRHYLFPVGNQLSYVVIMTRNRQPLPFEQVTVAELLRQLESQFPKLHQFALNRKLIYENYLENAKKGMQVLKEQLKQQENKFVYFNTIERQIDIIDLANIGSNGKLPNWIQTEKNTQNLDRWGKAVSSSTNYPLLRLKKGVKEDCATSGPQWLVFKLDGPINAGYGGAVQLMDNFVNRFNYDYVYRYFFGKDKVIEPYQPLGLSFKEKEQRASAASELSAAAKKNAADKTVLLFEDFSNTAVGAAPQSWKTQRSEISGEQPVVATLDKVEGKWLRLKRNAAPKNFPQNINGDFELSYDLLVQKGDVPWGTPGIDVQLKFSGNAGEKNVILNVSPGDMNRADAAGWIMINGLATCKVSNYYSVTGFTGSKPVNKATVSLQKKGESILITCNNSKVYECNTAFSPSMVLKDLNFYVNEKNQFYISNIHIKKL